MKKTVRLVVDPEIPRALLGDGMHDPTRDRPNGNKPPILKIGNAAKRRDPNSPALVPKERHHGIVRQSIIVYLAHRRRMSRACERAHASLAVNRVLSVIPSVQTVESADPNASILVP